VNSFEDLLLNGISAETRSQAKLFLDLCSNLFNSIGTEHMFLKKLHSDKSFEMPRVFNVNNELEKTHSNYKPTLSPSNIKGCIIPIKFQLKNVSSFLVF